MVNWPQIKWYAREDVILWPSFFMTFLDFGNHLYLSDLTASSCWCLALKTASFFCISITWDCNVWTMRLESSNWATASSLALSASSNFLSRPETVSLSFLVFPRCGHQRTNFKFYFFLKLTIIQVTYFGTFKGKRDKTRILEVISKEIMQKPKISMPK